MIKIIISKEFSETPGGRHKKEGNFSGEQFREELLEPKYLKAKEQNTKLLIDFDGGYGYATSFLEEAFGGLARKYDKKEILSVLEFKSEDQLSLIEKVKKYINNS